MKKFVTLGVIASALVLPVLASAATTADLKLIGTITPSACVPNFTGGSTIDYGNIAAGTLSATAVTSLPEKTTKFSVACDAPVKFALAITDERAASKVTGIGNFGLGVASNNAKIGGYSLTLTNVVPDTGSAGMLFSLNSGSTWGGSGGDFATTTWMAFSAGTGIVPAAHKSITGDLKVQASIDKTSGLPITSQINIDGLSTIEVKYL